MGEFEIAAGEGLKFTFTMDDGAVRIRTVALEEALSSTDTDNGGKIYKHIRLAFDTLDQTINIFNETFGTPVDGALIVKNTKQRQLVNYYNGFMPTGKGSSSVAYWAGLRVDMQHGTRFETENENDGFLYFGNANNGGLGANDGSLASYSAIYDYNEAHPSAHINDDLTFYVCNVNVGAATEAVTMSFDVAYNTYASLIEKNGDDPSLFERWIKVEYTPDFGDTWVDISGDCQTDNQVFRYTTQRVDLSTYDDDFVSFRVTPRFKQTLLLDNLSFDILGDPDAIEENHAPSVVEIYRQTPTTAYLICRPAAGSRMTEAQMRAVVPHMCVAGGNLSACTDFEIYRADEKHQIFEIIVRGIPQYLNERWVALEADGQVGGKKSFYESGANELLNVNFDHFIAGTDCIGSIKLGHRMLNWCSAFSVGGSAYSDKEGTMGGFAVMHDPLMNIREVEYREEQGATFKSGDEGWYTNNTFRIGNNMEASFRQSQGFYTGNDITNDGALSDGKVLPLRVRDGRLARSADVRRERLYAAGHRFDDMVRRRGREQAGVDTYARARGACCGSERRAEIRCCALQRRFVHRAYGHRRGRRRFRRRPDREERVVRLDFGLDHQYARHNGLHRTDQDQDRSCAGGRLSGRIRTILHRQHTCGIVITDGHSPAATVRPESPFHFLRYEYFRKDILLVYGAGHDARHGCGMRLVRGRPARTEARGRGRVDLDRRR